MLPDFGGIEAEEAALDFAEAYPHLGAAISLLMNRPSFGRATRIAVARAEELNEDPYHTFMSAADAVEAEHPLAATLMRRAMVLDTQTGGKSTRYCHAARHLAECRSCDAAITDYGVHLSHAQFLEMLRTEHGREHGFWCLVDL
nr:DUF6880 family protein [Leisingera sp. ANG-M7]